MIKLKTSDCIYEFSFIKDLFTGQLRFNIYYKNKYIAGSGNTDYPIINHKLTLSDDDIACFCLTPEVIKFINKLVALNVFV